MNDLVELQNSEVFKQEEKLNSIYLWLGIRWHLNDMPPGLNIDLTHGSRWKVLHLKKYIYTCSPHVQCM